MHGATIKYFKTLEMIHFQIKIHKRGQAKAKEGQMFPHAPWKKPWQKSLTVAVHEGTPMNTGTECIHYMLLNQARAGRTGARLVS